MVAVGVLEKGGEASAYWRKIAHAEARCSNIAKLICDLDGRPWFGNTVRSMPRVVMRRVDGEKSILGTELVEPK